LLEEMRASATTHARALLAPATEPAIAT
jgi:hypothetical protein